jgi:hypothetical protein
VTAWEWLDGKMDTLVSLEIVVTIETLRALIALEWTLVLRWCLSGWWAIHLLHGGCVTTVESRHHIRRKAADEHGLTVGVVQVRHYRSIWEAALIGVRRLNWRSWQRWHWAAANNWRHSLTLVNGSCAEVLVWRTGGVGKVGSLRSRLSGVVTWSWWWTESFLRMHRRRIR